MGEVFLAEADAAGIARRVVVKQIRPDLVDDPTSRTMFLDEARNLALLRHANLVQVVDFEESPDACWLVLEYVEGVNLLDVILSARAPGAPPLPPELAAYILREAAFGLDYAHRRMKPDGTPLDLVHRDVTPQNVLLSFEGEVKVADFGVAWSRQNRTKTAIGLVKGTPGFHSPEQARGEPLDKRSDLFSLATTIYWASTGVPAFTGPTDADVMVKVAVGAHPTASQSRPGFPAQLDAVLERCLQTDRIHRFASAAELAEASDAWLREMRAPPGQTALAALLRTRFPDRLPGAQPLAPPVPTPSPDVRLGSHEAIAPAAGRLREHGDPGPRTPFATDPAVPRVALPEPRWTPAPPAAAPPGPPQPAPPPPSAPTSVARTPPATSFDDRSPTERVVADPTFFAPPPPELVPTPALLPAAPPAARPPAAERTAAPEGTAAPVATRRRAVPIWAFVLVALAVALGTITALAIADAVTGGGRLPLGPFAPSQPARR